LHELTRPRPVRVVAIASALIGALAFCASPGVPPGGPIDTKAPELVDVAPDSGATGITPKEAIFRFDEVVSERPSGAPSLQALFLISPRDGVPNVDWHRKEVSVRPSRNWRRNTAYTITMLPGMTDLRGNVRNTGAITVFSTGAEIPTSSIAGIVFNWLTGNPAPRAFVEARPAADSTIAYVAATDSTGTFRVSTLAPGRYRVRAILDDNSNRGLDPREAWDTVTVALTDTAGVEMLAFPHDSVGARLATVGLRDSVTLELLFDHAINVNQSFDASSISIRRSDSVDVPVISVTKPQLAPDTTVTLIPARRPSRPIPSTSLLVKIGTPIKTRTSLRIRTVGVRGLDGVPFTSDRVVVVELPPPPAPAPPAVPGPPPPPASRGSG
jgi:uncharacterized protein (DUF2141 family)